MWAKTPLRVAVAALVLAWMLQIWWWPDAIWMLTADDAFYYFEIARNLVAGHGSTFDRINPTNGYHPLWQAVCVSLFAAGLDGLAAVRVALSVQLLLWAGALLALVDIVCQLLQDWPRAGADDRGRPVVAWTAAGVLFGLTAGPWTLKVVVNGLESALAAFALCWLLAVAVRTGGRPVTASSPGQRVALASLLAMAFLARTDAVFLLAAFGYAVLREALPARAWGRAVALLLPAVSVVAVYMAANLWWFGAATQVSGDLKRMPPGPRGLAVGLVVATVVVVGARIGRRLSEGETTFPRLIGLWRQLSWYLVFLALLVTYYLGFQHYPRLWYFGPVFIGFLLSALAVVADLADQALQDAPQHPPRRALAPVAGILLLPVLVGLPAQYRSLVDDRFTAVRHRAVEAAQWMDENLPADAVVGSWDAGVIGYFSSRKVVNLDGVVNSHAYLQALRDGTVGQRLEAQDVRWIVNHGLVEDDGCPEIEALLRRMFGADVTWTEVKRWSFRYVGSTNRQGRGDYAMAVFLYRR